MHAPEPIDPPVAIPMAWQDPHSALPPELFRWVLAVPLSSGVLQAIGALALATWPGTDRDEYELFRGAMECLGSRLHHAADGYGSTTAELRKDMAGAEDERAKLAARLKLHDPRSFNGCQEGPDGLAIFPPVQGCARDALGRPVQGPPGRRRA